MKQYIARLCTTFLLMIRVFAATSQDYLVERHLTLNELNDGLPSNEVYFTHFDNNGDLWICTDRGLARYDGISVKNFDEGDGLADNVVFQIYEDYKAECGC